MAARKRTKSYFYKYLRNFLLVMIVPILTILLVFFRAKATVEDISLYYSQNTLNQFLKRIEMVLTQGLNDCLELWTDKDCRSYSVCEAEQKPNAAYQGIVVANRLKTFENEMYGDVFVYFSCNDKIISAVNSTMQLDGYCDIVYGKEYRERFREMLTGSRKDGKPYILEGEQSEPYLCLTIKREDYRDAVYDYTVGIVLDQQYLSDIVDDMAGDMGGEYFLIYNDENVLLSAFSESENVSQWSGFGVKGNTSSEVEVAGEHYFIQVRKSEVLDVYYAYAVQKDIFWGEINHLWYICGIGGIASVLLGIVLAWIITYRTYRPLKEVVHRLQNREVTYNAKETTEFEYIENLIRKNRQETVNMEIALQKGKRELRDKYIRAVIQGDVDQIEADRLGTALCSNRFMVCFGEIERKGKLRRDVCAFVIANVFEEVCGQKHIAFVVEMQKYKFAILLNVRDDEEIDFRDRIQEGKAFLDEHFAIGISCGISLVHEEIDGIAVAYEEACRAWKYNYLLGKELIIGYEEIADRKFTKSKLQENDLQQMIVKYVINENQKMCTVDIVREIMESCGIDRNASIENVEYFRNEMTGVLNKAAFQCKCWNDVWEDMAGKLMQDDTLEAFAGSVADRLDYLKKRQTERQKNSDICRKTHDCIRERFSESQLTLKYLADLMGYSPAYLSRLYREYYHVSISDDVLSVRCAWVKEALKQSRQTLQEIAEQAGFSNADVMIKTFKRMEGITPGEYRKMNSK